MLHTGVKLTNPPPAGRQLLLSKQLGNRWNPISLRIVREDLLLFVCGMWQSHGIAVCQDDQL